MVNKLETAKGAFSKEQIQKQKLRFGLFVLLLDDRSQTPDFSYL